MSQHSLPPDRSTWPSNPYLLLGVSPGVSPRDLHRAYLHLVRSHKPEQAPEEFRLIRAAYEALKGIAEFSSAQDADDRTSGTDTPSSESWPESYRHEQRTEDRGDPWERAQRGEIEEAYRDLAITAEGRGASERVYLQLYWLLETTPRLDPDRAPFDWLVRGLLERGPGAARLRTLLTREAAYNAVLAFGYRFGSLLTLGSPIGLLEDVTGCRWRLARAQGQWKVILDDVRSLQGWVPRADPDVWVQLLISAAMNMAWGPDSQQAHFASLKREAEEAARERLDLIDDLSLVEFVERAVTGLLRLRAKDRMASKLHDLLRRTWDQPTPGARSLFNAHLAEVAANPVNWFWQLDPLMKRASAAVLMLLDLPSRLGIGAPAYLDRTDLHDVSAAVLAFLASRQWWDYPTLRTDLLRFCLSEMIAPAVVARVVQDHPEFQFPDAQHLADVIRADWPLVLIYRDCEIVRD